MFMRKITKVILLGVSLAMTYATSVYSQYATPQSQMERLTRGVVAMHKPSGGNYVTWRLLGTDASDTRFDVIRSGTVIATDLRLTNYDDVYGGTSDTYQIVAKSGGSVVSTSASVCAWDDIYKYVKLQRPEGGTFTETDTDGATVTVPYSYYPHDCSVADLDGDGDYELIVKWNPTNAKDNSTTGYTGACVIDAYKIDYGAAGRVAGTMLWRVNLGKNIRSGSHYTQFLVYDFDGDGKAEMVCKTAPGSVDGKGMFVSAAATDAAILSADNAADYRNASGIIKEGPEYLTVFNGETGAAVHTIWYNPNRAGGTEGTGVYPASKEYWGDDYANRSERYLACVAYLQGADRNPSAVMCRGYYTRSYIWAVNFDGSRLHTLWRHASTSRSVAQVTGADGKVTTKVYTKNTSGKGNSYTAYGQGNHNISVADVDGDGCDEIIYGSAVIDHNGFLLYSTGLGHGDAIHVGDLMPDRDGLEVFVVHEDAPYGFDVHDAATGELLHHVTGAGDTGRGMAADIDVSKRGYEFWSSASYNVYDNELNVMSSSSRARPPYSHRVYWNGEGRDVMLDGVNIYYGGSSSKSVRLDVIAPGAASPGGSKAYPCLSADLLGDWREEIVLFDRRDSSTVVLFSSPEPTDIAIPTLMHDHVYRMAVAWQNVGYNQPPHLGYFLPDSVRAREQYNGVANTRHGGMPRVDGEMYNVAGQKVADSYRGMVIRNRRKYIL